MICVMSASLKFGVMRCELLRLSQVRAHCAAMSASEQPMIWRSQQARAAER